MCKAYKIFFFLLHKRIYLYRLNNLEYKHNRVYDKNDVSEKKCNLTSTKPCIVLTIIKTIGCRLLAPGTNKLRNDEQKIAVPKILLAGYLDAKKPPGT